MWTDPALILDRQLLAAWLNLAHGSIAWDDLIDTDGDAVADTRFLDYLQWVEAARLDPATAGQTLTVYADVIDLVNRGLA